jgi:hypothetical protein
MIEEISSLLLFNKPTYNFMPVIPATWEVEVGGSQSEASLWKNVKPYLKNKLKKKKEIGTWLK